MFPSWDVITQSSDERHNSQQIYQIARDQSSVLLFWGHRIASHLLVLMLSPDVNLLNSICFAWPGLSTAGHVNCCLHETAHTMKMSWSQTSFVFSYLCVTIWSIISSWVINHYLCLKGEDGCQHVCEPMSNCLSVCSCWHLFSSRH